MSKIENPNLDKFIADSEELAALLNSTLPAPSRVSYHEGFFAYPPDSLVSFDDGEGGHEYQIEIEIDVASQTYRIGPDAPDSGQVEGVDYRILTTVQEVVDFIHMNCDW